MRVAIVGGTGLLGRRLTAALTARGDDVVVISRGGGATAGARPLRWDPAAGPLPADALDGVDAAVNLAGEPVLGRLWTPPVRREIRESRLRATQPCPALTQIVLPAAAASVAMSASSSTIWADFPPSSSTSRFSVPAAMAAMRRPLAEDPVNVIRSTRGSVVRISPMRLSEDVTTLNTPGGMSVSSATSRPSTVAAHGVSGAGLSTTVQPAASAGESLAIFR